MSLNIDDRTLYKLKRIRLLVLDVDGVLSDGSLIYTSQGIESKAFFVQDGVGIKALQEFSVKVAIITGRVSTMVAQRAKELGITYLIQGRDDKYDALQELIKILDIKLDECAYMGDDLPDLKAIAHVGLGAAPANACNAVLTQADFVSKKQGGYGAVRELCELILMAQGYYDKFINQFR